MPPTQTGKRRTFSPRLAHRKTRPPTTSPTAMAAHRPSGSCRARPDRSTAAEERSVGAVGVGAVDAREVAGRGEEQSDDRDHQDRGRRRGRRPRGSDARRSGRPSRRKTVRRLTTRRDDRGDHDDRRREDEPIARAGVVLHHAIADRVGRHDDPDQGRRRVRSRGPGIRRSARHRPAPGRRPWTPRTRPSGRSPRRPARRTPRPGRRRPGWAGTTRGGWPGAPVRAPAHGPASAPTRMVPIESR